MRQQELINAHQDNSLALSFFNDGEFNNNLKGEE